ncbi:MAG: hypothetical protein M1826_003868 [Phylliscum demangeonii]|nr:MAG: hypothetical protein M1826_003868 [Phylliscum demangeonii]
MATLPGRLGAARLRGRPVLSARFPPLRPLPRPASWVPARASIRWQTSSVARVKHPADINYHADVNGPVSTLPPPLVLPEREALEHSVRFYVKLGFAYLNFYKTALKNVYYNRRSAKEVVARIGGRDLETVTRAAEAGLVTRAHLLLLRRSRHDMRCVPLFALLVAVCGEFTPFVVRWVSPIVPGTCKIPRQVEADQRALERRRANSYQRLIRVEPLLPRQEQRPPTWKGSSWSTAVARAQAEDARASVLHLLDKPVLAHLAITANLHGGWWPNDQPPASMMRARVRHHARFLDLDDALIRRDGGVEQMASAEVTIALMDRGVDVLDISPAQQRRVLSNWLRIRHNAPPVELWSLLLTRPRKWRNSETAEAALK